MRRCAPSGNQLSCTARGKKPSLAWHTTCDLVRRSRRCDCSSAHRKGSKDRTTSAGRTHGLLPLTVPQQTLQLLLEVGGREKEEEEEEEELLRLRFRIG